MFILSLKKDAKNILDKIQDDDIIFKDGYIDKIVGIERTSDHLMYFDNLCHVPMYRC